MADYYIIKSNVKGHENWSGKEFSEYPAKIYTSFTDAAQAINQYWINEWGMPAQKKDDRAIIIKPLSENQKVKLLAENKIRW